MPQSSLYWRVAGGIGTAVLSLALGTTALAQAPAPAPIPLGDFFKLPAYLEMLISPDGKKLATTSEVNGRLNVVVIDLDTKQAVALTNWDNIDVGRLRWVGNKWLLYSAIELNAPTGQENQNAGGLFAVTADGKISKQIIKTARQQSKTDTGGFLDMQFLRKIVDSDDEIIVQAVTLNDDSYDVYRYNLLSGRDRLLTRGRPSDRLGGWLLDSKNVARVAVASARGASQEVISYYRSGADDSWKELRRFDGTKPPAFVPLAVDVDDKTLLVASNEGRDNMAIFRFDPEANKFLGLVAQHPTYDLGASPQGQPSNSLIFDADTRELVGISVDADRPTTVWLDESRKSTQATLDRALPGKFNSFGGSKTAKRYVVNSSSDTSPGTYYIFDETKRSIEQIGPSRPWLEGKLANVTPFRLKTRDGLEIPSYYVLPKDYKPGTKLPTVVHIHGGPMARDVEQGGRFGFSFGVAEAQILASRGYAVVLPNFRITPELGSKLYYAGFGTYGRQMSDDHDDAFQWAIDQGFADPNKICISGASYGGFAALQNPIRGKKNWACAVVGLPVADQEFQRSEADYARSPSAVEYWKRVAGVPDWRDPIIREISPVFNADKLKAPVFMYVGEEDTRTPPKQAERMAEELKKAGNPVKDYFVGKGEGHGFRVIKTNVALYERMLKFLEENVKNK